MTFSTHWRVSGIREVTLGIYVCIFQQKWSAFMRSLYKVHIHISYIPTFATTKRVCVHDQDTAHAHFDPPRWLSEWCLTVGFPIFEINCSINKCLFSVKHRIWCVRQMFGLFMFASIILLNRVCNFLFTFKLHCCSMREL